MDYNKVLLAGRLTRNVELRFTPGGTAVCDLGLATNNKYKNKAGETVEDVVFVDVVCWGSLAENCAANLKKGSPIFVDSILILDQWETKEGEKRSRLRVRADRVQFLGQKDGDAKPASEPPTADEPNDEVPF